MVVGDLHGWVPKKKTFLKNQDFVHQDEHRLDFYNLLLVLKSKPFGFTQLTSCKNLFLGLRKFVRGRP